MHAHTCNARTTEVLQNMATCHNRTQDHWRTTVYRKAIGTLHRQPHKICTPEVLTTPHIGNASRSNSGESRVTKVCQNSSTSTASASHKHRHGLTPTIRRLPSTQPGRRSRRPWRIFIIFSHSLRGPSPSRSPAQVSPWHQSQAHTMEAHTMGMTRTYMLSTSSTRKQPSRASFQTTIIDHGR